MKRHSLFTVAAVILSMIVCTGAQAALEGISEITVTDGSLVDFTYNGTTYATADLVTGTTTRWYVIEGTEYLWPDGDPVPAGTPTTNTSTPKVGDIGANADDFIFNIGSSNHISSLDGIDFQQTIFDSPTDIFFMFERGGNDAGSIQLIYTDLSLGDPIDFAKGTEGGPYADTGVSINGQNAWGLAITSDVPVLGFRVTAGGHDAFSVSTVPEPATMLLLGLGGLILRKRK